MTRPAKLTADQARDILTARGAGESWKEIAQRYGVERTTAWRAVEGVLQHNRRVMQRLNTGQHGSPRA